LYGDVEFLDESAVTTLFRLLLKPPERGGTNFLIIFH
jgi:hypothetical protein